jgi:secreted trypsin-like serine protease
MRYYNSIILILGSLLVILCTSGIIRHDISESKYLELANQKQFDCVGQVFIGSDTIVGGSCVLINKNYVLSAAHVFMDSESITDSSLMNQGVITFDQINEHVYPASRITIVINGQKISAKSITIHPVYLDSLTEGNCDLALIELEESVTNTLPAKLNYSYSEINADVVGVGFGATGPADRPDKVTSQNIKIAGENAIDSIGGYSYGGNETKLICDFDHPNRNDCNKMGSTIPKPLEYITSGGDSGGALFMKDGEIWKLVGICSGSGIELEQFMKSFYYGQVMEWTRVSAFAGWIESNMN